jgi:hypothetical protein
VPINGRPRIKVSPHQIVLIGVDNDLSLFDRPLVHGAHPPRLDKARQFGLGMHSNHATPAHYLSVPSRSSHHCTGTVRNASSRVV